MLTAVQSKAVCRMQPAGNLAAFTQASAVCLAKTDQ